MLATLRGAVDGKVAEALREAEAAGQTIDSLHANLETRDEEVASLQEEVLRLRARGGA